MSVDDLDRIAAADYLRARAKVGSGLRGLLDDAEAHRDRLRAELLKLARAVVVAQQQFAEPPVDLAESILDSHARGEL